MTQPLIFPRKVLDQHLVALGKTGSGKSSALRHVVEYLLEKDKRVCVVDPKGDWYGLKSSADGKSAGFPVILFGDFKDNIKRDVPLIPRSKLDDDEVDVTPAAKHVADLIVSGNRPCVIGMRGWTQGNMMRFWIDFASGIFNGESGELYLVIDEVHNFAPKGKLLGGEANRALHWANRIMNEGRGIGLVNLIASQRPQKVHNDTLTACETLVAMRVVHKADRDAIEDWIKGCGDPKQGAEVLNSLAGMKRGEAFVWSPEAEFGPRRLAFPMFETFDSFAPARLQAKVKESGWASVDLTEVKARLATVIEKAKAEDPGELLKTITAQKREITRLDLEMRKLELRKDSARPATAESAQELKVARQQIAGLRKAMEEAVAIIIKLSAIGFENASAEEITRAMETATKEIKQVLERKIATQNKQLETLKREAGGIVSKLRRLIDQNVEVAVEIKKNEEFSTRQIPAAPVRQLPSNGAGAASSGRLVRRQQQILNALKMLETLGIEAPSREAVALFVGRSTRPSRWGMDLKELNEAGLVSYPNPGDLQLTQDGREIGEAGEAFSSRDKLHDAWFKKIPRRQVNILQILIAEYPGSLTRTELAEKVQRSTRPSRWGMDLKEMRTLGLIEYPQPSDVAASSLLFPPGLQ